MGAGASANDAGQAVAAASGEDLKAYLDGLDEASRSKLAAALAGACTKEAPVAEKSVEPAPAAEPTAETAAEEAAPVAEPTPNQLRTALRDFFGHPAKSAEENYTTFNRVEAVFKELLDLAPEAEGEKEPPLRGFGPPNLRRADIDFVVKMATRPDTDGTGEDMFINLLAVEKDEKVDSENSEADTGIWQRMRPWLVKMMEHPKVRALVK